VKKTCKDCKKELPIKEFHKNGKGGFRADCKSCRRVGRKKSEDKPLSRYKKYKRNAKRRGIDFSLTKTEFYAFEGVPCHYCGSEVHPISLDRIDNDLGYEKSNVVSCCFMCNSFKHVFDENDFINHVMKIFSYQNRKASYGEQERVSKETLKEDIA
jgi:hypothetical protein